MPRVISCLLRHLPMLQVNHPGPEFRHFTLCRVQIILRVKIIFRIQTFFLQSPDIKPDTESRLYSLFQTLFLAQSSDIILRLDSRHYSNHGAKTLFFEQSPAINQSTESQHRVQTLFLNTRSSSDIIPCAESSLQTPDINPSTKRVQNLFLVQSPGIVYTTESGHYSQHGTLYYSTQKVIARRRINTTYKLSPDTILPKRPNNFDYRKESH